MKLEQILLLHPLARLADHGLLLLRLVTGVFLMYGTLDNVVSAERMEEFVRFLTANGFALPGVAAPLSVYAQFLCGLAFVLGLLTRWAGLIMAVNFAVAVAMVHWSQDFRGQWPALILVFVSLYLAVRGGGRFALDRVLEARQSRLD